MQPTPYVTPTSSRRPQKPEEFCGVCFSEWKLHHKNGLVHKHGHRHDPCLGSHKPPIENPSQDTPELGTSPVNPPQAVTRPPATITPESNDDLQPLPSSFTTIEDGNIKAAAKILCRNKFCDKTFADVQSKHPTPPPD